MAYIIKQPYWKVIREVQSIEQKKTTETRYIYLYEDKITTKYHEFPMEKMLDVSFKKMQSGGGLLFLHTDHGVYSYHVPASPSKFIEASQACIERYQLE